MSAALDLPAAAPVHEELRAAFGETDRLAGGAPDALAALDVAAHRESVNGLLRRASELARADVPRPRPARGAILVGADLRGAILVGHDLSCADLRGADLRGAVLVGADLRGADLRLADLTGADLRGARADPLGLRDALFVTPAQLASLAPAADLDPPRTRGRRRPTGGKRA